MKATLALAGGECFQLTSTAHVPLTQLYQYQ